ncbi:MAG: chemotaxis protein CheW [Firmicutes bacterium]|nr:chemotaxis protein CheW [Bacillota bacterium]
MASSGEIQLVVFKLNDEEYGVPVQNVQEIIRMTQITKIPKTPKHVTGVINRRGDIIPIVDLKNFFELETSDADDDTRIVVVEVGDKILGVIVDHVSEVLRLPEDAIEPPPRLSERAEAAYFAGIGKQGDRLIMLLDLPKIVPDFELDKMPRVDESEIA